MKQNESILNLLESPRTYILLMLGGVLFLFPQILFRYGPFVGLIIGLAPILLVLGIVGLQRPREAFYSFFCVNYIVIGFSRYMYGGDFPLGVIIDALIGLLTISLILKRIFGTQNEVQEKAHWVNGFTVASFIWLLYSFFQLFNPHSISSAWAASIRGIALYMFAMAVLVPLFIRKFKDVQILMLIWSGLTLLAVFKALIQKFIGFDAAEQYWLFALGGQITHIIGYGVRYFSFFSDAANFGSSMALSMTVFIILALFVENKRLKIWYLLVSVLALYAILISGTRVAVAVPFVGFAVLVFLSKRVKYILSFSIIILFAFAFLKFTYIGNGNTMIRRMRTAFDANEPSMMVRYENQAKMKVYMEDKPFGVGLGLGGLKAKRYVGDTYLSKIPTDSWFVMLWVETGIVGLVLNILILLYILGYGAYQVMFRIQSPLLRGFNIALIGGCSGMVVASYANEILGQFPNGIIIYTSMAILFLSPKFDKELCDAEESKRLAANNHEE